MQYWIETEAVIPQSLPPIMFDVRMLEITAQEQLSICKASGCHKFGNNDFEAYGQHFQNFISMLQ